MLVLLELIAPVLHALLVQPIALLAPHLVLALLVLLGITLTLAIALLAEPFAKLALIVQLAQCA